MRDDLLPCPFCGGLELDVRSGSRDREGIPTSVYCDECGCNGPWVYTDDAWIDSFVANQWNTRVVSGREVTFKREVAGVVSPNAVWVVFCGGYMYGPCENWQDVENQIRNEWEHDRHLVG